MDGLKKGIADSLQIRLSVWLSAAILGVAMIAGVIAFYSAFNEAHELQDDVLRQVAALYDRHRPDPPRGGDANAPADEDVESRVFIQFLSTNPTSTHGAGAFVPLALPRALRDGLQTVSVGNESFRVMVKTLADGERLAVAQQTAVRDEIARNSGLRTLMPFLVLIPILLLLVAYLVRQIFKPVAELAGETDQRAETELHPIAPERLPAEIRPFIAAINRLLRRVEQAMGAQRRFVADAAHELRSPLTALALQAERLAGADMPAEARERLDTLRQGIERARALLDQLLALARAQSLATAPTSTVSVRKVYRRVLEDLMPLAEAKGIDIGVAGGVDAQVRANEAELMILVRNLVDNAIRYTPSGGRVDLAVVDAVGATILVVEDNGPGIPLPERARAFDPFYRIVGSDELGSGLGLAIVQAISDRIGAKVSLGPVDEPSQSGLRVVVTFPKEMARQRKRVGSTDLTL
ncbi:MAG: ATP-binding protein [Betaproteobacteria bacterium]